MRKHKKTVVWPVYFDSSKTRKEGRKVPKSVAIPSPNLNELQRAIEHLKLSPEVEVNTAYPTIPWLKTGRLWVRKSGSKMQTLMKIAKQIVAVRQQTKN